MKIFPAVFLLLSLLALHAPARTVPLPGENITLDVPDAWTEVKKAPYIYAASEPSHTSAIAIAKLPNPEGHGVTPSFIAGTKKGMADSAAKSGVTMKVESEKALSIGGAPAYLFTTENTAGSRKTESCNYVIATHDFYYLLVLQTSEPATMPALQRIANSFHFTVAPKLPDFNSDSESEAYKAGEDTARIIGYAAVLLVFVGIVGVVIREVIRAHS